ncbi:hypothetical protein [Sphingopyxis sp. PAMC25046]|uniref:hypothetical protein n=1 Tax=Sphingopyxis sp. PAMC25046 TaxID=2565556 RepID=UPI00144521A9|nr:hypothetical protein [Sphingopyxis sp. PAMC25046]
MPVPSPRRIAISLNREQRDLVLSGVLDFDEADVLPKGLFEIECWRDWEESCERVFWRRTWMGEAVKSVLEKYA